MLPNIQFCSDSDQILLRIWLDLDLAVNLLRSAQNTRLTAKPSMERNYEIYDRELLVASDVQIRW